MGHSQTIAIVVGTRPEAIKLAPVIQLLRNSDKFDCKVVLTAQHRELLDDVLSVFHITPDIDLALMKDNQGLTELTSRCLLSLDNCFNEMKPDLVLAQGDTTTVMAASMASFYNKIPFGHVEAGLRSGNKLNPFPEEVNRMLAGVMATWHFAPTKQAADNLISEGVPSRSVFVTGNTVIDALLETLTKKESPSLPIDSTRKLILMTAHRRENFGKPMEEIFSAVNEIANSRRDVQFLYPVHPNPNVRNMAYQSLGSTEGVKLCDPLNYIEFVHAMNQSHIIMSDSGGVQEEAPAIGKPVVVLRENTERPEAVEAGAAVLAGTSKSVIIEQVSRLLDDEAYYESMSMKVSPFGDGTAANQIVSVIENHLS